MCLYIVHSCYWQHASGAWTWRCELQEAGTAIARPVGQLAELASIFGVPLVRLRCAIPEELLQGSLAAAMGRATGISAKSIQTSARELRRRLEAARRPTRISSLKERMPDRAKQLQSRAADAHGRRSLPPLYELGAPQQAAAATSGRGRYSVPTMRTARSSVGLFGAAGAAPAERKSRQRQPRRFGPSMSSVDRMSRYSSSSDVSSAPGSIAAARRPRVRASSPRAADAKESEDGAPPQQPAAEAPKSAETPAAAMGTKVTEAVADEVITGPLVEHLKRQVRGRPWRDLS